jgi:hypothetical protein
MHRQGFDLQLTQYDDRGWRATFSALNESGISQDAGMAVPASW